MLWFEAISGLKINLDKSSILTVGDVVNLDVLAYELGCRIGVLPSTYLSLPLGTKRNSLQVWDGVEERFRKKLALWKRHYISKGGILTLIKSTLSNLPIYTMSLFRVPKGVMSILEKIQLDSLWGRGNLDKKIHLVNWKTVCTSKKGGGLDIRSLLNLNKSFLGKWNWRLAVEDNPPWKDLIKLKYGLKDGGWFSVEPRGSFGVGLWKDIRKEAQQLKQKCKLMLGDGGRIRFWEDRWCGENPLCVSFPTLYVVAASKGAIVGEVWETTGGEGGWNLRFIRPFNDWEMEETRRLISLISNKKVFHWEKDIIFKLVDKKGHYIVKANYGHLIGDDVHVSPIDLIWNSYMPPKVIVFTREGWWSKVLTMNQLKKRGFQLTSRCPLCKEDEENVDHLFHCPSVWGYWVALFSLIGMDWVCPFRVNDLMVGWTTFPIRKKAKNLWKVALSSLF